jgi:hypothetical protein
MYTGDIQKWKKFANSLMLRLALRLVKVDEGMAQQWAENAINGDGGLMTSNDDIAYVPHQVGDAIGENSNGEVFDSVTPAPPYMSQTFVEWMKSNDDPRLRVYGEDDGNPAVGLPNGYDDGGQNPIQEHESWVECSDGSSPDPCGLDVYMLPNEVIQGRDDPMFFQTYAEVELMLAEVQARNWGLNTGKSAEQHYRDGIRAALNYLSMYGSEASISEGDVDTYVSNAPWSSSMEDQIRQINEQYWAATFLNEYESYSNWRRTGYPYDGHRTEAHALLERRELADPVYATLIFGPGTLTRPRPRNFLNAVDNLPEGALFNTLGFGRHQLPFATMGILFGGNVRVGLEDNVYYREGEFAEGNAQLVERTAELARTLGRDPATPARARELLGL